MFFRTAPLHRTTSALAVLIMLVTHFGLSPHAQSVARNPKVLRIVVIQGEDAVNIIQQKTAVAPVVEVRDENDLPVAGVLLRFRIGGGRAVFGGGLDSLTLTTNASGRASVTGLQPLQSGAYRIEITATYQGQTTQATITQNNFATVSDASRAGRKVQSAQAASAAVAGTAASGGGASGAAAGGAAASGGSGGSAAGGGGGSAVGAGGGGGVSKLAILGIVGAGAAGAAGAVVAVNAATRNTAPSLSAVTASRSTALLGTEVAFSAQATDRNNDALTYAWDFGDGTTSTEESPIHAFATVGSFAVRLTVSDGKASERKETAVTIKSMTGTFAGDALTFVPDATGNFVRTYPVRLVYTLTQSGTAITGSVTVIVPPGEAATAPGDVTGSVNRTMPTVTLLARFPPPVPPAAGRGDIPLSMEPGPDGETFTGNTALQTITLTRQ